MSKGHYRCYVPKDFQPETMAVIRQANIIIEEYERKGYSITLRQLYYQFVARALMENKKSSYDRLGDIVSNGRLAGLISWTAIEDRTRNLKGRTTFNSPADVIRNAREGYLTDRWAGQQFRPEVWIEKDALVGVISGICNELCVDFFACRGYNSQSEQWRAGMRFAQYVRDGQRPIVFHLGDHDPDGVDMTRDNRDRLSLFAGTPVQVVRLALNMEQIERYKPPPNPTKPASPRYADYSREYGESCWELDALPPDGIAQLIQDAVLKVRDPVRWSEAMAQEAADKDRLDRIIEQMEQ